MLCLALLVASGCSKRETKHTVDRLEVASAIPAEHPELGLGVAELKAELSKILLAEGHFVLASECTHYLNPLSSSTRAPVLPIVCCTDGHA